MQAVKRRDTAPELTLRSALSQLGVRGYRIDRAGLPGRPDLAFGRDKLAVFVDGAFWHGRQDKRVREGKSSYWDSKVARNQARDARADAELRGSGWRVLRLWDDEVLRQPHDVAKRVYRLLHPAPVAEFFAGIGLVRRALQDHGFEVVFANDIEPTKHRLYAQNFDSSHFRLDDIRSVKGRDIPDIALATASFPCTDLSLAGGRQGLDGRHSSMFWEFARVLKEMGRRRPLAVMLENVPGFGTSHGGRDLHAAITELNKLGYFCDLLQLNAESWVPQSRPRMFVVGSLTSIQDVGDWRPSRVRPKWISDFVRANPDLALQAKRLPEPPQPYHVLREIVEHFTHSDERWWDSARAHAFHASLSPIQKQRLNALKRGDDLTWRTAYRRTRDGKPVWEIRSDQISGCLRTARGGSSRQALVEVGHGGSRVRWMTSREYARLMGVPDYDVTGVSENQALFGFGDAVCVPAVAWLAREYLAPLAHGELKAT